MKHRRLFVEREALRRVNSHQVVLNRRFGPSVRVDCLTTNQEHIGMSAFESFCDRIEAARYDCVVPIHEPDVLTPGCRITDVPRQSGTDAISMEYGEPRLPLAPVFHDLARRVR